MQGDQQELTTSGLANGGDAVARDASGRTVFVRGAAPHEHVVARITESRSTFARAELVEVIVPSPDRVEPRCPYHGVCGGCQWQHVSYAAQLDAKHGSVRENLRRIGGIADVEPQDPVASPATYGYRNRIELTPGPGSPFTLGYHGRSDDHVSVKTCDLLPQAVRTVPKALQGALRYLQGSMDLGVHRVSIRVARRGRIAVDLWTEPGSFPRDVAGRTLVDATGATTVSRVMIRPEKGPRAVRGVEALVGPARWEERLSDFSYDVSPPSFFQVNTVVAEAMVAHVLDRLAPTSRDVVLDAYCGVGTFTLPLAATGAAVIAAEAEGSAVRDLRRNLERAGLEADVAPGDVARSLPDMDGIDLAVVDPPRSGLSPDMLDALARAVSRRVVYVSCDTATLARDVARLGDAGWRLQEVTPFDLFPQTYHVEAVAVLDRQTDR